MTGLSDSLVVSMSVYSPYSLLLLGLLQILFLLRQRIGFQILFYVRQQVASTTEIPVLTPNFLANMFTFVIFLLTNSSIVWAGLSGFGTIWAAGKPKLFKASRLNEPQTILPLGASITKHQELDHFS
jgi:hypothetical protein